MIRGASCVVILLAAGFSAAAEKELHVVALFEGSFDLTTRSPVGAKVKVDRPGKEVVLIACGETGIEWEITATPETKLTKVIFGGQVRQMWRVPHGVEVDEMSQQTVKQRILPLSIRVDYRIDTNRFRDFVLDSKQYTGLEIASFQGARRFDHKKPFVVDSVQNDEQLSSDFPKLTPAAQVPKFKFEAVRVTYGQHPRDVRHSFGGWAQFGPAEAGFVPLPEGVKWVTFDTKAKQSYGLDEYGLSRFDPARGTGAKIDGPPDSNPNGYHVLTYDAKRDRVLVANGTALFEYTAKNGGAWKKLGNNDSVSKCAALVWQAKTDMLLGFGVEQPERGSSSVVPMLYELHADGSLANKYELSPPLFPVLLGYWNSHAQLIDLGRDVGLLLHNRPHGLGWRGSPQSLLYVINPKSGKVQLAWKE